MSNQPLSEANKPVQTDPTYEAYKFFQRELSNRLRAIIPQIILGVIKEEATTAGIDISRLIQQTAELQKKVEASVYG